MSSGFALAHAFLIPLSAEMPKNEYLTLCGFRGDPFTTLPHDWTPRPWRPGEIIMFPPKHNAFVSLASFKRSRRLFAAGRALMIDDTDSLPSVKPSAIVQTSLNRFQFWFFLSKSEPDPLRFSTLIKGSVTRVGRLPGFTNGKPQHDGFLCKLCELDERRRYPIAEIQS